MPSYPPKTSDPDNIYLTLVDYVNAAPIGNKHAVISICLDIYYSLPSELERILQEQNVELNLKDARLELIRFGVIPELQKLRSSDAAFLHDEVTRLMLKDWFTMWVLIMYQDVEKRKTFRSLLETPVSFKPTFDEIFSRLSQGYQSSQVTEDAKSHYLNEMRDYYGQHSAFQKLVLSAIPGDTQKAEEMYGFFLYTLVTYLSLALLLVIVGAGVFAAVVGAYDVAFAISLTCILALLFSVPLQYQVARSLQQPFFRFLSTLLSLLRIDKIPLAESGLTLSRARVELNTLTKKDASTPIYDFDEYVGDIVRSVTSNVFDSLDSKYASLRSSLASGEMESHPVPVKAELTTSYFRDRGITLSTLESIVFDTWRDHERFCDSLESGLIGGYFDMFGRREYNYFFSDHPKPDSWMWRPFFTSINQLFRPRKQEHIDKLNAYMRELSITPYEPGVVQFEQRLSEKRSELVSLYEHLAKAADRGDVDAGLVYKFSRVLSIGETGEPLLKYRAFGGYYEYGAKSYGPFWRRVDRKQRTLILRDAATKLANDVSEVDESRCGEQEAAIVSAPGG